MILALVPVGDFRMGASDDDLAEQAEKPQHRVLIGGGIKGGQVIGKTDAEAAAVVERGANPIKEQL
jgi:Protein of unknown function (DUF1501)